MKKINVINYIKLRGSNEYVRMDSLPKEQQLKIGEELNQQALESIGYKKIKTV